ncbi:MAG: S8 family serine peptidase, partial [Meiothermus sp.]|nr:S8 family serine peptidase [Meiothermus sp.]
RDRGWNSWAGGWNSWAGGWNSWAGGATPPAPPSDNSLIWDRIRLHQAHRIARNFGAGVKVAVLDTGLETAHPMFTGRLAPSSEWRDFVDNDNNPQEGASTGRSFGHGTAVAGIVLQVAPRATILPIRVLNADGMGTLDAVVSGINHALNSGARVINLSLGSTEGAVALETILRTAASRGVYIVASAGNAGRSEGVTFPGRYSWASGMYPFVLGVGSVDNDYFLSTFSNYGNDLVISALGEQIASAFPGNRTARVVGTSFAAPLVSGALALAFGETTSTAERGQLLLYLTQGGFKGQVMNKNLLSRGTSKLGDGILDVESALYAMPSFTPRISPVAQLGSNLGLEEGLRGWTTDLPGPGSITAVSGQGRGGSRAAMISVGGFGDYSLYRTINGLKPNTNYVASVWVRGTGFTNSTAPGMWVSGFGNLELWDHRDTNMWNADNTYRKLTLAFRTGPLSFSAEIGVWAEAGTVYVDDFSLVEAGY